MAQYCVRLGVSTVREGIEVRHSGASEGSCANQGDGTNGGVASCTELCARGAHVDFGLTVGQLSRGVHRVGDLRRVGASGDRHLHACRDDSVATLGKHHFVVVSVVLGQCRSQGDFPVRTVVGNGGVLNWPFEAVRAASDVNLRVGDGVREARGVLKVQLVGAGVRSWLASVGPGGHFGERRANANIVRCLGGGTTANAANAVGEVDGRCGVVQVGANEVVNVCLLKNLEDRQFLLEPHLCDGLDEGCQSTACGEVCNIRLVPDSANNITGVLLFALNGQCHFKVSV